jgi:hypothetical protein
MGLLYGLFFNLLTFPGIISRNLTTNLLLNAFTKGQKPEAYVETENLSKEEKEEEFKKYIQNNYTARIAIIITIIPFITQTILTIIFASLSALAVNSGGRVEGTAMFYVMTLMNFLSLSFGVHAFPSRFDIQIFRSFEKTYSGFKNFVLESFKIIFIVVNYLKSYWIDLFYAVIVFFLTTETIRSIIG